MTDNESDNLLERCLAGGQAGAWRELIEHHGAEIRKVVHHAAVRCGLPLTAPDLDELVQDLYCRLLAVSRQSYRGRSNLELWRYLVSAARSLVVDRKRKLGARKRRPSRNSRFTEPSRLRSLRLDPEARLLKQERRQSFCRRCLEVVRGGRELRALTMALIGGWSSRDIARELRGELSAERVDQLVHLLRRHLARDGIRLPRRYSSPVAAPRAEPSVAC